MGRNSRKARRLLVGDERYLWSVGHDHRVGYVQSARFQGCPDCQGCRDLVIIRRFGAREVLAAGSPMAVAWAAWPAARRAAG